MLCRLAGMADRLCTSPSTARATVARVWGGRCAGGAETLSASPLLPSARLPLPLYPSSLRSLPPTPHTSTLSTTPPPHFPPPKPSPTTTCLTLQPTCSTSPTTARPSTPISTILLCTKL